MLLANYGACEVDRVRHLEEAFCCIAATRMADIPVVNRALSVEALGFEQCAESAGGSDGEMGILITPWFMNLIWLAPYGPCLGEQDASTLPVGKTCMRRFGSHDFEFIGASEPQFGPYQFCSLFSPMFEFANQASARATATEVLRLLRASPDAPLPPTCAPHRDRRGFLFGRRRIEGESL